MRSAIGFSSVGSMRNSREVVIARGLQQQAVKTAEAGMPRLILQSTITCPNCGGIKTETMPTNACQFFYNCAHCGVRFKPKAGDCCVFCSHGDVPCPSVQEAGERGDHHCLVAGGTFCMFCL
jgi:hypothetical protein